MANEKITQIVDGALEKINGATTVDELVEITPKSIRIRKKFLTE